MRPLTIEPISLTEISRDREAVQSTIASFASWYALPVIVVDATAWVVGIPPPAGELYHTDFRAPLARVPIRFGWQEYFTFAVLLANDIPSIGQHKLRTGANNTFLLFRYELHNN